MSWASHNPELYDEIVKRGVMNYLMGKAKQYDDFTEEEVLEFLDTLEGGRLYGIERHLWDLLTNLAVEDIHESEVNYFSRRADAARDAAKDREMGL